MGKRSDFERRERDWYPTPLDAMLPLLPHLPEQFSWYEPCAGDGAIIDHMQLLRPKASLMGATDLLPLADGIDQCDLMVDEVPSGLADYAITNLPWDRKVLHPLIMRISERMRLWTLLDSNWANTAQATPYLERCSKIVQVGRIKWIPGTKMAGKDDVAWFLFDRSHEGATRFFGRMSREDKKLAMDKYFVASAMPA